MKAIAVGMAAGAAALALIGAPVAHTNPNPDPSEYYARLREEGFLVDGNESYLLGLAMIVCDMSNAGYDLSDTGDYIARRESLTHIQGYQIASAADIWYCTQLHPRLVP